MTPANSRNAPETPETGGTWLPVEAAAAAAGISAKTLRRRIAAGAVKSRRVVLARGGAAFEVEMDSVLDSSKPNVQTGVQTDARNVQTDSHKGFISSGVLSVKSPSLDTGLEVEMDSSKPMSKPTPEMSKPVSISSERETELKDEIRFLRGIVESDRRDMAELRSALRKALDNAPRQLLAPEVTPPGESPQTPTSSHKARDVTTPGAVSNEAGNGEISSYGALADWLEREISEK